MQYESMLAMTTLGNLGSATEVQSVSIPACDNNNYQFDGHCTLGKFYSLLKSAIFVCFLLSTNMLDMLRQRPIGLALLLPRLVGHNHRYRRLLLVEEIRN